VIDVTHQVPGQDVRRGAAVLAQTAPWLPPAVHLGVVDPGVGTQRRGIAVVAARGVLVGPDNGLLLPAADALGGVTAAYELADPAYRLGEVSATFHGRDVFAPAAAHLCLGLDPARLGPPVADLASCRSRSSTSDQERYGPRCCPWTAGNVQLAATELGGLAGAVRRAGRRLGGFRRRAGQELVVLTDLPGSRSRSTAAVAADSASSGRRRTSAPAASRRSGRARPLSAGLAVRAGKHGLAAWVAPRAGHVRFWPGQDSRG
jgi:hypothetical protein